METILIKNEQAFDASQKLDELIPWIIQAGRLDSKEIKRLRNSLAAEIIICIAYLSGCNDPERIAVSHILTYLADTRTEGLFSHKPGESLFNRLQPGNYYPGGDKEIIKAGMLLLELLSLNDHKADIVQDMIKGKENPLIMEMSYENERRRISNTYQSLSLSVRSKFNILFERTIKNWIWYG